MLRRPLVRNLVLPLGRCLAGAVLALTALATLPAFGQAWPAAKPVTIVVPLTAGSAIDVISRQIGTELGKRLNQAVIIDNRVGASGNIGAAFVAKAPPDGYTAMITTSNLAMAPALTANLPWDPKKSFTPIGMLWTGMMALAVHPDVPARTLPELIAYAQKNPGMLNYATPGTGSLHHFATELVVQHTGIKVVHVPYKGLGPAVVDLVGGRVQIGYMSLGNLIEHHRAGKVRILVTSSEARLPQTPEVPTLRELGMKDAEINGWVGMFMPAATPADIVARMRREIGEIMKLPATLTVIQQQASLPLLPGTAEHLARDYNAELELWPRVAAKAGIKPA